MARRGRRKRFSVRERAREGERRESGWWATPGKREEDSKEEGGCQIGRRALAR